MAIVVLKLQDVKRKTEERPKKCLYCERQTFQRWGSVLKSVKDVSVRSVRVYRYRLKTRTQTVRGYKSWLGMHNGLLIAGTSGD